jgi:RNA polymerase sigma factor for flagellar operon FliA
VIPQRTHRLRSVEVLEVENEIAIPPDQIEIHAARHERETAAETIAAELGSALAELKPTDGAILRLHFVAGLTVAEIARALHLDQKPLYRRIRKLCEQLRERLVAAGIDSARANEVIGHADVALDFGLRTMGNLDGGPSFNAGSGSGAEDLASR